MISLEFLSNYVNFIGNACLPQTSDCLEREQVFLGWGPVKSVKIRGIPGFLLKNAKVNEI